MLESQDVAVALIPDSAAPYGRDDNGNPIVPMRSDQEIAIELLDKPALRPGACPHKNDPENCTLCGTKGVSKVPLSPPKFTAPETEEEAAQRQLAQATAFFGVQPKRLSTISKGPRRIRSYRELLVMEHAEVAALLDAVVGWREVEGPKILMDKAVLEGQASKLKEEITALKQSINTRSAAWQKANRPEDKLEKNDRERLKREETKQLYAKEVKWRGLRSRLLHWETDPQNRISTKEIVPVLFEERYPITHRTIQRDVEFMPDQLRQPKDGVEYHTELLTYVDTAIGDEYDAEGYRKVIELDEDALLLTTDGMSWDGWREWENKVILQAITIGLIRPDNGLIELYPGLGVYQGADDIELDTTENSLAVKTGGAVYGGGIYSEGVYVGRHRNYARKLSDFTNAMDFVKPKGGSSGDESTDGGDADESYSPD